MDSSQTAADTTVARSGSIDLFKALAQHRLDLVDELARQTREMSESSSQKEAMIALLDSSNTERLRLLRSAEETYKGLREQLRKKDAEIRTLTKAVTEMRGVAENRLALLKESEAGSMSLQDELARRQALIDALTSAVQLMQATAEERLALLLEQNEVMDGLRQELAAAESAREAALRPEPEPEVAPEPEIALEPEPAPGVAPQPDPGTWGRLQAKARGRRQ